ncbi:MAG: hypothetical protein IIC69_01930 [Nanoarchaeota archaeon]|nr:hypothetical protein [Nanoarchaeota archaeon]
MADVEYTTDTLDAIGKIRDLLEGLEGVTSVGTPIGSPNSLSQSFKFRKDGSELEAFVQFNSDGCTYGTIGVHSKDPTSPFPEDFIEAANLKIGGIWPYSSRAYDMEPPEGDYTFYWRDLYLH